MKGINEQNVFSYFEEYQKVKKQLVHYYDAMGIIKMDFNDSLIILFAVPSSFDLRTLNFAC